MIMIMIRPPSQRPNQLERKGRKCQFQRPEVPQPQPRINSPDISHWEPGLRQGRARNKMESFF